MGHRGQAHGRDMGNRRTLWKLCQHRAHTARAAQLWATEFLTDNTVVGLCAIQDNSPNCPGSLGKAPRKHHGSLLDLLAPKLLHSNHSSLVELPRKNFSPNLDYTSSFKVLALGALDMCGAQGRLVERRCGLG